MEIVSGVGGMAPFFQKCSGAVREILQLSKSGFKVLFYSNERSY